MASLPTVGGSTGTWGTQLNEFLEVGHNADGTLKIPGVFYASDYGASFDGIGGGDTDNTSAIQDAIDAAMAYNPQENATIHGAVVQLPAGIGKITGKLTMGYGVWLRGYGTGATIIDCQSWSANADPAIYVDATNMACKLSDFGLIFGTTAPTTAHGIEVESGVAYEGSIGGITTEIERVIVKGAGGNGVKFSGVENRLRDVYVARSGQEGFWITASDAFISNCTADTCTGAGFYIGTSNSKFVNDKAFGCTGSGWNINGQRNMFSSCEAQDNGQYGFNDAQGDNTFASCVADSNGTGGGTNYGFHLTGTSTAVGCFAINRTGTPQTYGYYGGISGNSTVPSIIGCTSRLPGTAHVDPATVGAVSVNNLYGSQSVAYASSITPDPYQGGSVIVGTLTNTITVNAVATSGLFVGMKVGFQFTQDGTGRAVSFNSQYKTAAVVSTTPSSVTRIQFEWDGSFFRETGRAVT